MKRFVAALNAHDVEAMLAIASDEVQWMSVAGDETVVEADRVNQLAAAMTNYLASLASPRSEIRSITGGGPFVHTVEEAFRVADGVEKSACGAAVYEIGEGTIVNVW